MMFWKKKKPLKERLLEFLQDWEELAIQYPRTLCMGGMYRRCATPDMLALKMSKTGKSVKKQYPIAFGHNIRTLHDIVPLLELGKYYKKTYYLVDDKNPVYKEYTKILKKGKVFVFTMEEFMKEVNPKVQDHTIKRFK